MYTTQSITIYKEDLSHFREVNDNTAMELERDLILNPDSTVTFRFYGADANAHAMLNLDRKQVDIMVNFLTSWLEEHKAGF